MKPTDAEIARILKREGLVRVPKRESHGKPPSGDPYLPTVEAMKARYARNGVYTTIVVGEDGRRYDLGKFEHIPKEQFATAAFTEFVESDRVVVDPATGKRVIVNAAGKVIGRQG